MRLNVRVRVEAKLQSLRSPPFWRSRFAMPTNVPTAVLLM